MQRKQVMRGFLVFTLCIILCLPYYNLHRKLLQNQKRGEEESKIFNIGLYIKIYNGKQFVRNMEKFGPITNDTVIIIVQVHNRINYLKHVIDSLSLAWNISNALVIFSHDYYDEDINNLVQSIEFCRVLQMFFPYSIQLHSTDFPGYDPNDCPRDMNKQQALNMKCTNALHPDTHGHYREAKYTQPKHHWWWKMNRVFDELQLTKYHTGLFLFLEDDHYVAPDFLFILQQMKNLFHLCPLCQVLSLTNNVRDFLKASYFPKVSITNWTVKIHNMGMAFNRTTWNKIKSCGGYFCYYDDYNFDWSLQYLFTYCIKPRIKAMAIRGPRVFHIGHCGLHNNGKDCSSNNTMSNVKITLELAQKHGTLFPSQLWLTQPYKISNMELIQNANGGWSDPRDHKLCLDMINRHSSIETLNKM